MQLKRRLPATAAMLPTTGSSDGETEEDEDTMGSVGRPLQRQREGQQHKEESQSDTEVVSQIKKPPYPRVRNWVPCLVKVYKGVGLRLVVQTVALFSFVNSAHIHVHFYIVQQLVSLPCSTFRMKGPVSWLLRQVSWLVKQVSWLVRCLDFRTQNGVLMQDVPESEWVHHYTIIDNAFSHHFQLPRVSSNPELWGDFILCDLGWMTRQKRESTLV